MAKRSPKRKQSLFSLMSQPKEERSELLANNPLDPITLMVGIIAIGVLGNLYIKFLDDPVFPGISTSSLTLFWKGGLGFLLIFFNKIVFSTHKSPFENFIALKLDAEKDVFDYLLAFVSYVLIQFAGFFLLEVALFQIAIADVYAFYIAGSIIEEILYRGAICALVQSIVARFLLNLTRETKKGKKTQITKEQMLIPNILAILVSAILFYLDHEQYYGDLTGTILTLLGGMLQAFWYIRTKQLLAVYLPHAFVNAIAAQGLIQRLGEAVI